MESKTCTQCNIEKHINNFFKKTIRIVKITISKEEKKRYYENKDKISIQQKI